MGNRMKEVWCYINNWTLYESHTLRVESLLRHEGIPTLRRGDIAPEHTDRDKELLCLLNPESVKALNAIMQANPRCFIHPEEQNAVDVYEKNALPRLIDATASRWKEQIDAGKATGEEGRRELPALATTDSTLRPYQLKAKSDILAAWERHKSVMFQMPTGTGKTRLFVSLIADIRIQQPHGRVLIVTHRKELVDQVSHSLSEHYHLPHGILAGSKTQEADKEILVASIQTLVKRRVEAPEYIIIDEAHHSPAPSYRMLFEMYPAARKLGVTATPYRLRKADFGELYDKLLLSDSMKCFIAEGYLAGYRYYTASARRSLMQRINRLTTFGADGDYAKKDLDQLCNSAEEIEFLHKCYERYAKGKKGIVYAVNQAHATRIAALFDSRGTAATSIDSKTPATQRAEAIRKFQTGEIDILVNVELFTEGFDCPSIEFVLLARPTRSLALYLQQVGRALRPSPNGGEVIILDTAGLHARFGLPERSRDWQMHFQGTPPKRENYTRPLGETVDAPPVGELKDVSPCTRYGTLQQMKGGWYLATDFTPPYLLDTGRNRTDTSIDTQTIRLEADGNYSAEVGKAPGVRVRFTPDLRYITEGVQKFSGCTFQTIHSGNRVLYLAGDKLSQPIFQSIQLKAEKYLLLNHTYYTTKEIYPQIRKVKWVHRENVDEKWTYYFRVEEGIIAEDTGVLYRRFPYNLPFYYSTGMNGKVSIYSSHLIEIIQGESLRLHADHLVFRHKGTDHSIDYIRLMLEGALEDIRKHSNRVTMQRAPAATAQSTNLLSSGSDSISLKLK